MRTETVKFVSEEMEELEEAEEVEFSSDEASVLYSEMQSKISEALSLGVFTNKEAIDWENGFEACDKLEHMENLIEIVDDFIASGLDVVDKIVDALDTDLLTDTEKSAWETKMDMLSFQDKCDLLHEITSIVRQMSVYKKQLLQIVKTNSLPNKKAEELLENFQDTEADKKEGVVTRAVLEVVSSKGDNKEAQPLIRGLISSQQFASARQILHENKFITPAEYAELVGVIDTAEIVHLQHIAQAA